MAALDEPTRLVEALAQPGLTSANGVGEHLREVDATATARLRDFARRHQVTLNTLVQAGWALLLQRYTGQHTVVFGATVSGRPADLPGVENQVGLFINTLPVVVTLAPQMTLDELLQGLQRQNLALREQEHTPLFELQRWAGFGGEAVFRQPVGVRKLPGGRGARTVLRWRRAFRCRSDARADQLSAGPGAGWRG